MSRCSREHVKEAMALKESSDCQPIAKVPIQKIEACQTEFDRFRSFRKFQIPPFQILKLPLPSNNSVTQVQIKCNWLKVSRTPLIPLKKVSRTSLIPLKKVSKTSLIPLKKFQKPQKKIPLTS